MVGFFVCSGVGFFFVCFGFFFFFLTDIEWFNNFLNMVHDLINVPYACLKMENIIPY